MSRELDIGKKSTTRDLIKKAAPLPGIDFIIQNRLSNLRNDGNDNNNDSGLSPPPSPPSFKNFQQPPLPPPSSFKNFISPPPPPPQTPPVPSFNNFLLLPSPPPQPLSLFGSQTIVETMPPKEKIIDEIDNAIYKMCDPPKIELGYSLLNVLTTKAEDILADNFVNDKATEEKTIEQLKDEYKFDEIKDAFDEGAVPHQLEFFYGGAAKSL